MPDMDEAVSLPTLSGAELLSSPLLNKGMAFTQAERDRFHLHGLLPPHVATLDEQIERRLEVLRRLGSDIERYSFLRDLQDNNETLFYALLVRHLPEMMPIVYTPTVGLGCEQFSHVWRKPRGVFLSYPNRQHIREILAHPRYDPIKVIVMSDGERILGLGDQGAGGMGIPIGKLALYTACAGIHPAQTLPIMLDVGTDNAERLADPLYIGWRHERIRGDEYDAFVEEVVSAIQGRWPDALLQWEDFARGNAGRLLNRYRDRLCTFNDDIQGTAAAATGTMLAAIKVTGIPLTEQRIAIVGAGSAGCGIGGLLQQAMIEAGLSPKEAKKRFYAIDRNGLLVDGMAGIEDFQRPFVQPRSTVRWWWLKNRKHITLLDVMRRARITTLIGVSGQPGAFDEKSIRVMASRTSRPVIFPLSNPTHRAEAKPEDLVRWTEGRGIIGSGSPFSRVRWKGRDFNICQTNNSYIFPGVGLGVIATGARRVSDGMFMAAAKALGEVSPAFKEPEDGLLPAVTALREVAFRVAMAVGEHAQSEGLAPRCDRATLEARVRSHMWDPVYRDYAAQGL